MNFLSKIILLFSLILFMNTSYSQSILNNVNVSLIKIEQLSSNDIIQIRNEMDKNNISFEAMEQMALSKGMSPANFALLKSRIENEAPKSSSQSGTVQITTIPNEPISMDVDANNTPKEITSKIFGSELFTNPSLSFEPNSNLATPYNYILGTGDELQIVIYGLQEFATVAKVSKEGQISIPNVGQISVNGMTMEAATSLIKSKCGNVFSTIKSGQSSISVTLSKIRSIKVTIIGSKKPGNYSLSSLSTVFNALYLAGGPSENGSYRNIELIRGNKVFKVIDIYKFIINGDQSDNIGLKENDIIRIPTYNCRVIIEGQIKKEGIFELIPGENFNDLLKYCSGFRETAYLSSIKLIQNTEKELRIVDLSQNEYTSYQPKTGDVFKVGIILDRYENKISIKGAVFRPDNYSLTPGLKVSDLIKKADGLTEDAYKTRAQITRVRDDFSKEIISINLNKVFEGDSLNDIAIKKDDELLIFSLIDFKDQLNVQIEGQIRKPGQYPYVGNLTLFDLIIQAGGFTDEASKKIEISRLIKKDEIDKGLRQITEIIVLEVIDLSDLSKNILLQPNDVVQIRKMPVYEALKTINIIGKVEYPGYYSISSKDERVLDLINRAGGLKTDANIEGIYIKRGDYIIPINYKKISKNPRSIENIRPQPGDELTVLKYVAAIKIVGSVSVNTEIPYVKGKSVRYYINKAGGKNHNGWKRKIYNYYPNGTLNTTKHFLFIKKFPKVLPGTVINIPQKPEKKEHNGGNIVTLASVTTSMTTMIAVLSQLFK